MSEPSKPTGPDLAQGIPLDDLADGGMVGGHVGEDAVLLARRGDEFFAIGATCTHYGGPLAEGLLVGDTVRCPWHHACFSLRTGEALRRAGAQPGRRAGASSSATARCFVRRKDRAGRAAQSRGASRRRRCRARRDRRRRRGGQSPRPRCSGAKAMPARHACSAPTTRRPTTGRTCPRTISRATRRRTGSRCDPPSSTRSSASTCGSAPSVDRASTAKARRWRSRTAATLPLRRAAARDRRRAGPARRSRARDLPHVHYLRSLADSRAIIAQRASRRSAPW